jgi:hypothetical protein
MKKILLLATTLLAFTSAGAYNVLIKNGLNSTITFKFKNAAAKQIASTSVAAQKFATITTSYPIYTCIASSTVSGKTALLSKNSTLTDAQKAQNQTWSYTTDGLTVTPGITK